MPVSGSKRFGGRRSRHGRGGAGRGDDGSGNDAGDTLGSGTGTVSEVGASDGSCPDGVLSARVGPSVVGAKGSSRVTSNGSGA